VGLASLGTRREDEPRDGVLGYALEARRGSVVELGQVFVSRRGMVGMLTYEHETLNLLASRY
jgi:hypothetical protein